jgi:hypothetical protein
VFAPDPDDDDEETLRKAADRPGTSTAKPRESGAMTGGDEILRLLRDFSKSIDGFVLYTFTIK